MFAVPLERGGYGIGVVSRSKPRGRVILCHFFGPRLKERPLGGDDWNLDPVTAVLILRVGDLGLVQGDWPVVGRVANWSREQWKVPDFVRRESLRDVTWVVTYADTDPSEVAREVRTFDECANLPEDGLSGYVAAELHLDQFLPLL